MADIENVEKLPRAKKNSLIYRIVGSIENGYSTDSRLVRVLAKPFLVIGILIMTAVSLIFLPFIMAGTVGKKLIETGKNGQRMTVNIMRRKLNKK